MSRVLRIGSRGSALALWQAHFVRSELEQRGFVCEVVIIKTAGDHVQDAPIAGLGLKGVFIKELEDALLDKRVDIAVHSMKDVPTETPAGLVFPAICPRHDPSDALLSRSGVGLRSLPAGALVGTGSLRRQAQLRYVRLDLEFADLRGNVDTRIRKLESGAYDAIVLARAGLDRLNLSAKITEIIPPEVCLPAVGQGAVGIEARESDTDACSAAALLEDADSRAALTAERTLLAFLEGGCQVPLGALAKVDGSRLTMEACVVSPDGREVIRDRAEGLVSSPADLGKRLGETLKAKGAERILQLVGRVGHG